MVVDTGRFGAGCPYRHIERLAGTTLNAGVFERKNNQWGFSGNFTDYERLLAVRVFPETAEDIRTILEIYLYESFSCRWAGMRNYWNFELSLKLVLPR